MKYLTNIDLSHNELQNAVIQCLTADPTDGQLGQVYFNTTNNRFRSKTSAGWVDVGGNLGYYTAAVATAAKAGLVKSGNDIEVSSDGTVTVKDNSHNHTIANITGLQDKIDDMDAAVSEVAGKAQTLISMIGTAKGLATLDDSGKVPASQLPSFVDDVIEGYYNNGKFYSTKSGTSYTGEITGESGKIYTDLNTNKTYRWSGTVYTPIKGDLALGETETTAYRGDRGKTAYEHSQATHAPVDSEKNTITSIKKNGTAITPDANRAVNIVVPTKTSELENNSGFITEHPNVAVGEQQTVTTTEMSWGGEVDVLVSVGVDDYGHATSRLRSKLKMPSNPVPNNIVKSYKITNPALTTSGGLCTWDVAHNLNDTSPIVAIFDNSTNEQVLADVIIVDANNLKIQMCSNSAIAKDAYRAKVIA